MPLPVDLSPKGETNTTLKGKDVAFIALNIRQRNRYVVK